LEQEDAIAHYDTIDGRTVITPSNKVCVYSPRFAAVREVVDVRAYARVDGLQDATKPVGPAKIDEKLEPSTTLATLEPSINRAKQPPSLLKERHHPGELARDQRVSAV